MGLDTSSGPINAYARVSGWSIKYFSLRALPPGGAISRVPSSFTVHICLFKWNRYSSGSWARVLRHRRNCDSTGDGVNDSDLHRCGLLWRMGNEAGVETDQFLWLFSLPPPHRSNLSLILRQGHMHLLGQVWMSFLMTRVCVSKMCPNASEPITLAAHPSALHFRSVRVAQNPKSDRSIMTFIPILETYYAAFYERRR